MIQKRDKKRDSALIKDYLKEKKSGWKYSISQLGVKYARVEGDEVFPLTSTRIHQILDHYEVEKNRKNKVLDKIDKKTILK